MTRQQSSGKVSAQRTRGLAEQLRLCVVQNLSRATNHGPGQQYIRSAAHLGAFDHDGLPHEGLTGQAERRDNGLPRRHLDVGEALGPPRVAVHDDAHIHHLSHEHAKICQPRQPRHSPCIMEDKQTFPNAEMPSSGLSSGGLEAITSRHDSCTQEEE